MKFVNIKTDLQPNVLVNKLKKADYYNENDKFGRWDIAEYNHDQVGIHLSYNDETKKICAYNENGSTAKDFVTPVNEIFTGKIVEKDGKTAIKGIICMAPMFIILTILVLIGLCVMLITMRNMSVAILFPLLVFYFMYVKSHYRANMQAVAYFLGEAAMKKKKKNNPNKKKGKYARK